MSAAVKKLDRIDGKLRRIEDSINFTKNLLNAEKDAYKEVNVEDKNQYKVLLVLNYDLITEGKPETVNMEEQAYAYAERMQEIAKKQGFLVEFTALSRDDPLTREILRGVSFVIFITKDSFKRNEVGDLPKIFVEFIEQEEVMLGVVSLEETNRFAGFYNKLTIGSDAKEQLIPAMAWPVARGTFELSSSFRNSTENLFGDMLLYLYEKKKQGQ